VSRPPVRRPGRVYVVADAGRILPEHLPEAAAEIAAAGVETVQLRAKRLADDALWRLAEALVARLSGWEGSLWIDDRVDLARALPFAGVHLGQLDLPPAEARRLLPEEVAIGRSTHDRAQLEAAARDEAVDWVALGPIFPTASKEAPDPVVGLVRLAELRVLTAKPLIAIGGIDETNIARVLAAGADAAAVISAACAGDVGASCRRLVAAARSAA
jgi:thiamine-phosphate pyrophosphorylase